MWTSPKTEYVIMMTELEFSLPFSQAETTGLYPKQHKSKVRSRVLTTLIGKSTVS